MKQSIVVRSDLDMGIGKLAAQVAHASLSALENADTKTRTEWQGSGQRKVVLKAQNEETLFSLADEADRNSLPYAIIRDAGRTELEPGTVTTLGIGPGKESHIDAVTGQLSLL